MIKIFRNIRLNLLSEGKTRNYLKYAFGEIFLVVIGILIALSINNWNENRKTGKAEISYVLSMRNDLKGDSKAILAIIESTNEKIKANELLMSKLRSFDTITDARPLFMLMRKNVGFTDLNVQDHTIEALKNSGNIEIISSDSIRIALQDYYDVVETIFTHQGLMNKSAAESERSKFFNYLECEIGVINNTKVPFDDQARANLPEAYAYLNHWVALLNGYVNLLTDLRSKNAQVENLINTNYSRKLKK